MFDHNSLNATSFNWGTALSMGLASDLSYQRDEYVRHMTLGRWSFQGCAHLNSGKTQGFVAHTNSAILIAFRGTDGLNDWIANLNVLSVQKPYGRVHRGFVSAFDEIRGRLVEVIRGVGIANKTIHVTGHSLGGAVATIAACELRDQFPITGVYTFGQPRLGDGTTIEFFKRHYAGKFNRFVFDDDMVTRIPPGYSHVGRLFHFDSHGFLQVSTGESTPDATTEPPPLTPEEFERLKATAKEIEIASTVAAPGMQESQDELADRSLEGIFPSVLDHRMSRYMFALRNQLPQTAPSAAEVAAMAQTLEAVDRAGGLEKFSPREGVDVAGPRYPVHARVRDLEWSPPPGAIVNSRVGPYCSIVATREAIDTMRTDPDVLSLNPSREISPPAAEECAVSVPFVRGDAVHSGNINERGDCAIIGLIDSGIDILHEAFLEERGQSESPKRYDSRIEAVWIQGDNSGRTPHQVDPAQYDQDYGTLYTRQQIQDFVREDLQRGGRTTPWRLRDPGPGGLSGGHGTHVASIAAGRAVGVFGGGMAPEARIVAVVPSMRTNPGDPPSLGYSNSHQDALAFLLRYKEARGLPMAVNVSLGMNAGAHDGTSGTEKVFDAITTNGKTEGFIIVKSAGNERGHQGHVKIQAAAGAIMPITWDSASAHRLNDYLEFWHDKDDEIEFELVDPSGRVSQRVSRATPTVSYSNVGNDIHLRLTAHVPDNDDNRLVVEIVSTGRPIQSGQWTLNAIGVNLGPAGGQIHGWVERDGARPVRFSADASDDMTLSIPGTAATVVCVAASNTGNPISLHANSSYGPTRANDPKPDINAPGDRITAAESNSVDHQAVTTMSGTSMAAPHVAGALALVMSGRHKKVQSDPTKKQFNATNLAGMLKRSARNFNKLHNKGTGYGGLDTLKFFNEADLA